MAVRLPDLWLIFLMGVASTTGDLGRLLQRSTTLREGMANGKCVESLHSSKTAICTMLL